MNSLYMGSSVGRLLKDLINVIFVLFKRFFMIMLILILIRWLICMKEFFVIVKFLWIFLIFKSKKLLLFFNLYVILFLNRFLKDYKNKI